MDQKEIIYEFDGNNVEFLLNGNRNVMVNGTQMAKIFGKRIDVFLKTEHVNEFINVLEFTPYGVNSTPLSRDEIIQKNHRTGTYMHRILALKFAAWLDPKFEVWVYMTIEKLILGVYAKQMERMEKKAKILNELVEIEENLAENEEFKKYVELQEQIKTDSYKNRTENKQQLNMMRELFGESIKR